MKKFVFTCGDINGIGPEIVIKTLNKIFGKPAVKFYFVCPGNIFNKTIEKTSPFFSYQIGGKKSESDADVTVIDIGNYRQTPGRPTEISGEASFKSIRKSYDLISENLADAIITAPISKTAIKKAGYNFPGHTEMFAEWAGTNNFMMMFHSKKMNAALVTIHLPINKVPGFISEKNLKRKIKISFETLKKDLNISEPKVAVLGLNPHAGEDGNIGSEEEKIIKPLIKKLNNKNLAGPFSPDAFFANKLYENFDLVLGMYHDQVLIPFKMMNFGGGVNYTAGLPFVRTSPDHGTAFDIAGKNIAGESSMLEAFYFAEKIVNNRKKWQKKLQ